MTFSTLSWSLTVSVPTSVFCVVALVHLLLDPQWLTVTSSLGISSTDAWLLWVVHGEGSCTDLVLSVLGGTSKHAFLGASTPLPSFSHFHELSHCSSRFALALLDIFGTCLVKGRLMSMVQVTLGEGEIFKD